MNVRPRKRRNSLGWEPRLQALTLAQESPLLLQNKLPTVSLPPVTVPMTSDRPIIPSEEEYSTSEDEHLGDGSGLTFHPALLDRLKRITKGSAEDLGLQLNLHPNSGPEMALVLYRPLLPPGVEPPNADTEESNVQLENEPMQTPEPVISYSWQEQYREKVQQEGESDEMEIDD